MSGLDIRLCDCRRLKQQQRGDAGGGAFEIINRHRREFLHCGHTSGRLRKAMRRDGGTPSGSRVNYWISVIKSCAAADSSGVPGEAA